MNINERVKYLRKHLRLSQKDFGERVEMSQGHLTNVETGKRELTDKNIKLICIVFNVSENWLRSGSGDMFAETDDALLEKLAREYNMSDAQQRIMNAFLRMNEQKREMVAQSFFMFVDSLQEIIPAAPSVTLLDNVSDEELELKKRQELIAIEFEAEKKGITSLASTGTSGRTKKA